MRTLTPGCLKLKPGRPIAYFLKPIESFLKKSISIFFLIINIPHTYAQPSISSFNPLAGAAGTTVTITGNNFSSIPADNIVYFGSVKAVVSNATSTTLKVTVPTGTTYGPISVTTNYLTALSTLRFIVTFPGGGMPFSSTSFAAPVDFTTKAFFNQFLIHDFDGDGKPDLVFGGGGYVGNGGVEVFRNTSTHGTISFGSAQDYVAGSRAWSVTTGDLDGDGKIDIAFNDYDLHKIFVLRNVSSSGTISFNSVATLTTWSDPYSIKIIDLNTDGKPDIALYNHTDKTVAVYLNTSSGSTISFANPVNILGGFHEGDLDNDGKLDLCKANSSFSNDVSVFRNTGSNGELSFAGGINLRTGIMPNFVTIGDIDLDGKNDLAVSDGGSDSISIFKNLSSPGTISFTSKIDFLTGDDPYLTVIGDLDGDGKPDIVSQKPDNTGVVSVLRNTTSGAISFDPYMNYSTGGTRDVGLGIGDLDVDGRPDLIISRYAAGSFVVLRNLVGMNKDTCKNAHGLTNSNVTSRGATLKWLAKTDPKGWQVQYKPVISNTAWTNIKLTGAARSVRISPLISNQKYKWRIRAKCDTNWTDYSNQVSFTTLPTSLQRASEEKLSALSLRPNPSSGTIIVQYNSITSGTIRLKIYDEVGKEIFTQSTSTTTGMNVYHLNLTNIASGIYYLELIDKDERSRIKFVIEK